MPPACRVVILDRPPSLPEPIILFGPIMRRQSFLSWQPRGSAALLHRKRFHCSLLQHGERERERGRQANSQAHKRTSKPTLRVECYATIRVPRKEQKMSLLSSQSSKSVFKSGHEVPVYLLRRRRPAFAAWPLTHWLKFHRRATHQHRGESIEGQGESFLYGNP